MTYGLRRAGTLRETSRFKTRNYAIKKQQTDSSRKILQVDLQITQGASLID